MSKVILQVNYRFKSSRAEHTAFVAPMAEPIASVPGLHWKIWLMNEAENRGGGIYLFENRESAQAFASSEAIVQFLSHPTIAEPSAMIFEPLEDLSAITRAPLGTTVNQP